MVYILSRMLLAGLLAGSCWSALGAEPVAAAGAPKKRLNGPHPVAVPLTIHHAGQQPRHVIVRVSAPVASGLLTGPLPPAVTLGEAPPTPAQAWVITRHPDGSARRVMLTFPAKVLPGKKFSAEYPASTSGRPAATPLFAANRMRTRRLNKIHNMFLDSQITLDEILHPPTRHIMLFRPPMIDDDFGGRMPEHARCLYSRWEGYLDQPDWIDACSKTEFAGGDLIPVHTSGHIFVQDIAEFVRQVNPRLLVPIHTRTPEAFQGVFVPVRVLSHGEPLQVT